MIHGTCDVDEGFPMAFSFVPFHAADMEHRRFSIAGSSNKYPGGLFSALSEHFYCTYIRPITASHSYMDEMAW
jgi:hypothetical protein